MAGHAQLHHKVVHQLLGALLGEDAGGQVPLEVDVQEGAHPAQAHGRAVLLLDGAEVAKVQPLHRLAGIGGGAADVEAVQFGHACQLVQKVNLPPHFLDEADDFVGHGLGVQLGHVLALFFHQFVHAVKGHPAVVADDTAPAVGVGQAGDEAAVAGGAGLGAVDPEHAVVVGGAVAELFLDFVREFIPVGLAGAAGHADPAEGVDAPLQRLVGLQAHDELVLFVQIPGGEGQKAHHRFGVHLQNAALFPLGGHQSLQLFHQPLGAAGGTGEKLVVTCIRFVVFFDKIPNVDFLLPRAGHEILPLFHLAKPLSVCFVPPGKIKKGSTAYAMLPRRSA